MPVVHLRGERQRLPLRGATPVFVDIEPETFNLDPADLRARRTARTSAAMVVDVFGHPADWDAIGARRRRACADRRLLRGYRRDVPRPAARALRRRGCFAFYPNKQMTTGEGGMIVTDDADAGAPLPKPAQPGTRRDGHVARARAARVQLPHGRAVGRPRRLADPSPGDVHREARRGAPMYTERLAVFDWLRPPSSRRTSR